MKAALIGDIHANLPALQAVLADVARRRIEKIWQTGDIVGYGASPEEVVQLLRRKRIAGIIGNYDQKLLRVGRKGSQRQPKHALKRLAFRWAWEHLSEQSRRWLRALPTQMRLTIAGKRILICHGSPHAVDEYIGADTAPERLAELAEKAGADVVVSGHTHRPFVAKVRGTLFVNTGSVGRSGDGDPRACYAILEVARGSVRARNVRVAYDLRRAVELMRRAGLPEEFAQMIIQATDLPGVERAARRAGGVRGARRACGPRGAESRAGRKSAGRGPDPAATVLAAASRFAESCAPFGVARAFGSEAQARRGRPGLNRMRGGEFRHARHATALALKLFDALRPLHGYGAHERFLLECAGTLHDVGWVRGREGHHKESMRMILGAEAIPFRPADRLVAANVARYHRRALPGATHRHFAELTAPQKEKVRWLAAILRVADGLDCNHLGRVLSLRARCTKRLIQLRVVVSGPAEQELSEAAKKGDLLAQQSGRELVIQAATR